MYSFFAMCFTSQIMLGNRDEFYNPKFIQIYILLVWSFKFYLTLPLLRVFTKKCLKFKCITMELTFDLNPSGLDYIQSH